MDDGQGLSAGCEEGGQVRGCYGPEVRDGSAKNRMGGRAREDPQLLKHRKKAAQGLLRCKRKPPEHTELVSLVGKQMKAPRRV